MLVLASYWPVLDAGFIWDDDAYVSENSTLRDGEGLHRIWFEARATPQYYPLVHTSYWLEHAAWGLDPTGYHLDNVLLHFLCAWLVWRILVSLGVPGAWFAAALFALHPVHVESVAWITERKNVLSGVFYLGAMLAFLRFDPPLGEAAATEEEGAPLRSRRPGMYILGFLLFIAALLSKTVTVTLPAALLLIHWWKRGRLGKRQILPMAPLFVVGLGFGLMTIALEKTQVGATGAEWSLSPIERVLVAGRALCFYLEKLVWPVDLSFIYPRWQIDDGQVHQFIFPIAFGILLVALWGLRGRIGRGPIAGLLFFAGTLFPALGFFDVFPHRYSYVADHFQYLASLGVLVPLGSAIAGALGRLPRPAGWAAQALILSVLGILVSLQTRPYRDIESLWLDTLSKNPDSYLAHSSLAGIQMQRGDLREAVAHYREALRVKPEDALALNNLAWFLATANEASLRDADLALELALRSVEISGDLRPGVFDTLAASYAAGGRYREAVAAGERGIALARGYGLEGVATEFEARVALYRRGEAYVDAGGGREIKDSPGPGRGRGRASRSAD